MVSKVFKNSNRMEDKVDYEDIYPKGISEDLIEYISNKLEEPGWIKNFRRKALKKFYDLPNLKIPYNIDLDLNNLHYYVKPFSKIDPNEIPEEVKRIWKKLGLSEKEQKVFAGLATIYDSFPLYYRLKKYLEEQGVIFEDITIAIKKYPNLVRKYFDKIIDLNLNKLVALNSAVFTSGSFIYVPKGVKIALPIHTLLKMTYPEFGQFERVLLIADKDSELTFVEGCVSPLYLKQNLHVGVAEIIAKENSKVKIVTLQNWSKNVINFVFSRIVLEKNAFVQLIEAHIGSKLVIKHPEVELKGENSSTEILEIQYSSKGQIKDMGVKIIHKAEKTKSRVISKSISKNGGMNIYRSWINIEKQANYSFSSTECHSLILDRNSKAYSYPYSKVENRTSYISHEAKVGKLDERKIEYIMSRGIKKEKAISLVSLGFLSDIIKNIPIEYSIEFRRLIEVEIEEE